MLKNICSKFDNHYIVTLNLHWSVDVLNPRTSNHQHCSSVRSTTMLRPLRYQHLYGNRLGASGSCYVLAWHMFNPVLKFMIRLWYYEYRIYRIWYMQINHITSICIDHRIYNVWWLMYVYIIYYFINLYFMMCFMKTTIYYQNIKQAMIYEFIIYHLLFINYWMLNVDTWYMIMHCFIGVLFRIHLQIW